MKDYCTRCKKLLKRKSYLVSTVEEKFEVCPVCYHKKYAHRKKYQIKEVYRNYISEQARWYAELYSQGFSYPEIGGLYNRSREYVRSTLERYCLIDTAKTDRKKRILESKKNLDGR